MHHTSAAFNGDSSAGWPPRVTLERDLPEARPSDESCPFGLRGPRPNMLLINNVSSALSTASTPRCGNSRLHASAGLARVGVSDYAKHDPVNERF